jgi:LCP family protein required for cell wall assembly
VIFISTKHKARKRVLIALLILFAVLAAGAGISGYFFQQNYLELPEEEVREENETQEYAFDRFDILLLGLDGREGLNDRTDTIMLLSIDNREKKARLLSIPRDTRVELKPGSYDRINAAYVYGGVDLARQAVEELLNTRIDRYAAISFEGVVELIDMVGGVDMDVPVRMYVPLEGIDLQKGPQTLNGRNALAYMRYRGTVGGDMDRMARQQEVLVTLAKNMLRLGQLPNLTRYFEAALRIMDTDLTLNEMTAVAGVSVQLMEQGIDTYVLPGENKIIDSLWYFIPDMEQFRKDLAAQPSPVAQADEQQTP